MEKLETTSGRHKKSLFKGTKKQ